MNTKTKTKKCKFCQSDIPVKAKVCPNCKRTLRSTGCLIPLILIFVIGAPVLGFVASLGTNDAVQKSISGVSDESEYITMDEFNQIKDGMSYDEVKNIIGFEGELSSKVTAGDITTVIYTWYGNGVAGSNANVTFQNDAAIAKAQVGLQ